VKNAWFAAAAAASALWGLEYVLLGRLFSQRVTPLFLLSIQMFVGGITLGGICIANRSVGAQFALVLADRGVLFVLVLSTAVFAVANLLIATSIKGGSPLLAGLVEISYPLFILLFSMAMGRTAPLDLRTLIGGGLIVCGAALLQSRQ
jgi:drug/metabolite transporter (DMT)-like permease